MASAAQHALDDALAGRDVDLGWIQLQPEAYVHGLRAVAQFLDRHDARYRALEAAKGRTAPQARMAVLHDRMRAWPLFVRGLFDAATPISAAELESVWDRLPPLVLRAVSIDEIRQLPEEFRDGLVEPGLVKRPIHVRRQLVGGLIQLLPEPRNRTTTLHIADIGRARRRALLLQLLAWLRGEPIPPMPVPAPTPPPVAGREPIGRQQRLLDLVVRNDLPPGRAILRARRKLAMRRALGWCRRHPEAVAGLEGPALERALTALLRAASRPTWIPMGRSMPPPAVAGPRARAPGRLGSGSARSLDA